MKLLASMAVLVSLTCAGCAVSGSDSDSEWEQESGATQYVDIMDFAATDQGAWYDLVRKLNAEVDEPGYTPLTFYCAVTSKIGNVHDCAWTFTSSRHAVDPDSAAITFDAPTYECHVHPKTTAPKLIALLQASPDAIHEPLPGMTGSIADTLPDCFAHPIGATPLTVLVTDHPTYVDAGDYYTSRTNQEKWAATYAALHLGFDDVCGDTFCGGDFGDLQSLELACAITKSTGNVKSCAWTFGGSYTLVKKTGDLDLASRTWTCPVAVHGTLAQLIASLAGATGEDAIHRALPGGTSAYDSIAGCVGR
jgi:hypothetical protein